jgi:hypothetical protein
MSKPISRQRSDSDSLVSSNESLSESSEDETSKEDEQSNSAPLPAMKTKPATNLKQELNSASISTTNTQNIQPIHHGSKTEISTSQQSKEEKGKWTKFTNNISPYGHLGLTWLTRDEILEAVEWLNSSSSNRVTSLYLKGKHAAFSEVDYEAAKAIAKFIQTDTSLIKLFFSQSYLDSVSAKYFAEAIKSNTKTKISELEFLFNNIGDEGTKACAETLKYNKSITVLNLASNNISDEGTKALAVALKYNTTITKLVLARNKIGNEGAKAIAEAIIANPKCKITEIDLRDNNISDEGGKFIEIINQQCALNSKRAQIEDNISAALDLLTAHPNPIDGSATSHPDVNGVIAKKLFVLDKSDKLISPKIRKNPNSVFNKYT